MSDDGSETIVTTRSALAAAIRAAVDDYFDRDPFVSGPKPRETGVSHIIAEIIARVEGVQISSDDCAGPETVRPNR